MNAEEKILAGYHAAVRLAVDEGQLIWRAFSAMLTANTVLVAISGAFGHFLPDLSWAVTAFAVLGILVCLAWLLVLRRQFSYYRYWWTWARHFEAKNLAPDVRMLSVGKTYSEGGTVELDETLPKLQRFPWTARAFRVESLMRLVIVEFLLVYGFLLYASLNHHLGFC